MPTEYKYDVFLSVNEAHPFTEWLEEHFLPLFRGYLDQEMGGHFGRASMVYYYKRKLEPGQNWPRELDEAISSARVALALCSPLYFHSRWCLREFNTFRQRAETTGKNVLIPVSIYDGEHFPAGVRDHLYVQPLSPFVLTGKGYSLTAKYIEFQTTLQTLCRLVGDRAKNAPEFAAWPIAEDEDPPPQNPIAQVGL